MLRIIVILHVIVTTVFGNASTDVVLNCEGIKFVKKGCYRDTSHRTLKKLVFSDRNNIDWHDWNNFLEKLACKCAGRAKESQYRYIGLQFYGECWSGEHSEDLFANEFSKKCIGHDYKPCDETSNTACTGEAEHNYVYEIVYEETKTDICKKLSPCVNGECVSTGDSYMCECVQGYEGQNCEKIIDPDDCAGNPCVNGECIDGVNSYKCKCTPGYQGTNCENNTDDCAGSPCVNGECIDGVNSYECKCNSGYQGRNCENNTDDCAGSPCVNGECIDGVNSYECKCNTGYEGTNCENNIDDCAGSPCVNGECIDGVNSYECKCNPGYQGRNCENNIDDCAGSPCVNGECIDGVNSYECKCNSGYQGRNCENNIDDCAGGPCVNGKCIDGVNSYECKCNPGYDGTNCENNVDDCVGSPCRNGECIDGVNSYECKCVPGYQGKNCENNIDDCAKRPCRNGGRCVDKVNSYQCICKTGYGGRNCETNINDCAKQPCRNGGRCIDKLNSYQCICKTGFKGVNCETNINDCAKNPCLFGGRCVDKVNSYQCICKTGYSGQNCKTVTVKPSSCINKNWWSSFDRQGWSTCANDKLFITGFYRNQLGTWDKDEIYRLEEAKCCSSNSIYLSQRSECVNANWWATLDRPSTWSVCPDGYFLNGLYRTSGNNLHNIEEGKCCKPVNHPKLYEHCYNEFIRYEFDKQGWTTCKKIGYYVAGVYRDHNKDWLHDIDYLKCCKMWTGTNQCASSPCVNGNCRNEGDSYRCQCKIGYEGKNCEKNINDCAKKPCKHGVCVDKVNAYVCLCKAGYTGRNCDTDIDECARKPCRNGARCINKVNAYQCVCKTGYKGVKCETNINDCLNHQCKNGGVCKDGINSYTCSCPKHYTGSKCEKLNKLNIQLKSLGCDDVPGWWLNRDCSKAIASIKVNGREYAKSKRGYNIVVFNNQGNYRESKVFDTHGSTSSVTSMKNYLRNLPNGQIVLVAICDEATDKMNKVTGAYECLREIGAVDPITSQHRSSFTLVGSTGPGRPSFIRQVQKPSGRGPSTITVDIPIPYTPSAVTVTPSQCINKNWWSSFDRQGWSTCANDKLFITGFYRNKLGTWDKDEIYRLEEAKCCSSNSLYLNQRSECKNANWWATLDRPSTWSVCPEGYFLNGLYRTSGNNLHNIEEGKCCKPVSHPKTYEHCYHEFIRHEFDKQGWTTCKKIGYYVAGVYRDHNKDWLHDIDYLKCCKMWTGP